MDADEDPVDGESCPPPHVDSPLDNARLAGRRAMRVGRDSRSTQALKLEPQPQLLVALGLLKTKPRPMISSLKSTTVPSR